MHRNSRLQLSSSGATAASTIPGRAPILHDIWQKRAVFLLLEDQAHEDSPLSFHLQVGVPCCSSWLQTLPLRHPGWLSTGKKRNVTTRSYGIVYSTKTIKSLLGNLCGKDQVAPKGPPKPQSFGAAVGSTHRAESWRHGGHCGPHNAAGGGGMGPGKWKWAKKFQEGNKIGL